MALRRFDRHSAAVLRSPRWQGARLSAKRRDGWQCVQCGARGRLEVDHIIPVRDAPERAYDLTNLQTLCVACHSRKTRIEVGMGAPNPKREAWAEAVAALMPTAKTDRATRKDDA